MYREGGIIGKQNTPTAGSSGVASGVWKINEVHAASVGSAWPDPPLPLSTTADLNAITNVPIRVRNTTTSSDNSDAFDVVDVNFTSGGSSNHKFFIGSIPGGPTTYYNDVCIGAFQVIKDSNSSIALSKGGNDSSGLDTTTSSVSGADTNPTNESYTSLASGSTVYRWNVASGTGSSRTGATDGVHDDYSASTLLPSPGMGVVNQVSSESYFYIETSGSNMIGNYHWLRTNSYWSLDTGTAYTLRICYHFMTSVGQDAAFNNVLYTYIQN